MKRFQPHKKDWWQQSPEFCPACNSVHRIFVDSDLRRGEEVFIVAQRYNIPTKVLIWHKLKHVDNQNETI